MILTWRTRLGCLVVHAVEAFEGLLTRCLLWDRVIGLGISANLFYHVVLKAQTPGIEA